MAVLALAFPPLGVRVIYGVLSAFSPALRFTSTGFEPSDPSASLAKFNTFTGSWQIFLVMFVIMELLVAVIYIVAGFITPTYTGGEDEYKRPGPRPEMAGNMRWTHKPEGRSRIVFVV